jgi:hypothetical protein
MYKSLYKMHQLRIARAHESVARDRRPLDHP